MRWPLETSESNKVCVSTNKVCVSKEQHSWVLDQANEALLYVERKLHRSPEQKMKSCRNRIIKSLPKKDFCLDELQE